MSHIPSSAMPHAKAHEPDGRTQAAAPTPLPRTSTKPGFPWLALAIGGALVAGTAATAAVVLRKPAAPTKRRAGRKPATNGTTKTAAKPRRRKAAD